MTTTLVRAGPIGTVDPKRSYAKVPIQVDWHDTFINTRPVGGSVALDFRWRPKRAFATGLQYKCTTAGVTSKRETDSIISSLPKGLAGLGLTFEDGTVVWTAEPVANTSLRSTVGAQDWPAVSDVVLSDKAGADLVYTVVVDGGTSGTTYEFKHQLTLANGEEWEGVVIMTVQD